MSVSVVHSSSSATTSDLGLVSQLHTCQGGVPLNMCVPTRLVKGLVSGCDSSRDADRIFVLLTDRV